MTKQTNADLIAENRKWFRLPRSNNYQEEAARRMALILDALEAAEQRADLADADLEVEQQKNAGYRAKNEQIAAVVEQVRAWAYGPGDDDEIGAAELDSILTAAPDDVLREVKAAAWDEGEEAGMKNQANWDGWRDTKPPITNPYRAREEQDR